MARVFEMQGGPVQLPRCTEIVDEDPSPEMGSTSRDGMPICADSGKNHGRAEMRRDIWVAIAFIRVDGFPKHPGTIDGG